jgi:outer membrane protein assembly factor BamE (lipoprotein component of BamABCDE complex)
MLKKALFWMLAVTLWSALFMGCSKPDRHAINYAQVHPGVSTKVDVMTIYGKPKFVLPKRDGTEQWSYDVDVSGEFVDKHQTLVFYFDKNGVLINKDKFTSKWP